MIKVILPKNNTNLTKDLDRAVLNDVVGILFNTSSYETAFEDRRIGRYIKIVNTETDEVRFVCFSNPNNNSRNAHLMQFVSPAYISFLSHESINKSLSIYLIRPDGNDRTDYIKMFYRCFLTIGINILNLNQLGLSDIVPFQAYSDLKAYRDITSGRNLHNRQTYFTDDDEQISLYGKTFGANAMESFIFGLTLSKVTHKKLVFYPVKDNQSDSISADQQRILEESGLEFGDSIELKANGYAKPLSRVTSRNTPAFHYNLLQKYGEKRCYLCGCDLEHLIIGAHIERITDIDKNPIYSDETKLERAIDRDNGLWLCANHDKMFEYGLIYFAANALKFSEFVTGDDAKAFIAKSIFDTLPIYKADESVGVVLENTFTIRPSHYNPNMEEYISKHTARVT